MRQRNAILETLELFRDVYPGITIGNMIAFLYTCENEGLTILDLAQVSGFYLATASRTIRAFLETGMEGAMSPELGLIQIIPSPRGKTLFLTEAGRQFRDDVEAIIRDASPIAAPADRAA